MLQNGLGYARFGQHQLGRLLKDEDTMTGIENLTGTNGKDELRGDDQDNILDGRSGNDMISGGAGNDTIIGGKGIDILTGGNGRDTFVFDKHDSYINPYDLITDFTPGKDRIDLTALEVDEDALFGAQGLLKMKYIPSTFTTVLQIRKKYARPVVIRLTGKHDNLDPENFVLRPPEAQSPAIQER